MGAQQDRVLVIGIDGGTWDVLDPLMSDGTMPNLADLTAQGAKGVLHSVYPPLTPPAWATVLTGKDPGGHGIFDFRRTLSRFAPPSSRTREFVSSRALPRPYVYDLIGEAGKRIISINVPLTYPPHKINGLMVTGMFTPRGSAFTYPASLQEKLQGYEIDLPPGEGPQMADWLLKEEKTVKYESDLLVRGCRRILQTRTRTALELMRSEAWDLFFVVFTGSDRISHHLWDELQRLDRPGLGPMNKDIRQFFAELDSAISALVKAAGPSTSTILVSDHGFGPSPTKHVNFDLWLEKEQLAHRKKRSVLELLRRIPGNKAARTTTKKLLRFVLPHRAASRVIGGACNAEKLLDRVIDNDRTLAKCRVLYVGMCGFDLNPKLAPPGSRRYDQVRSELIEKLNTIRDPETGEAIVEMALPREQVYHGPFADTAPDVVVRLNPAYKASVDLWARRVVRDKPPPRKGDHRFQGVFALVSPRAAKGDIPPQKLEDVAPTVLYLLDLGIPDDMTGSVIKEAIRDDYFRGHPPRVYSADQRVSGQPDEGPVYTAEEEADIEKRLKDIGYL